MDSLEELGKKAYQKQIWGDYAGAITIYNTAIKKFPKDPRLLNNRCCCYIELKEFKSAMEDADTMIRIFPSNLKSFYRKGEVLTGLKRYLEAGEAFQRVLIADPDNEDAKQQLLHVQTMQLCQFGYGRQEAQKALGLTITKHSPIANIENAEKILKFGTIGAFNCNIDDPDADSIYYSDDENTTTTTSDITLDHGGYSPFMDPSNPLKANSLWVGNVTESVTEKMLKDMFSKYGKILSICVYHQNFCAFINYVDYTAPGKAMKALQHKLLFGKKILIKFPDSAGAQNNKRTKAV